MAKVHGVTGRIAEAHALFKQSAAILSNHAEVVFPMLSEKQKFAFIKNTEYVFEPWLSLCIQSDKLPQGWQRDIMDATLRLKGSILEALLHERELSAESPEIADKNREISRVRQALAAALLKGVGSEDPELYRNRVEEMKKERERLEQELGRLSAEFSYGREIKRADTAAVQTALPKDSALLEFLRLKIYDFKPSEGKPGWTGRSHYAVLVLASGKERAPELVDIGDADSIDLEIAKYRTTLDGFRQKELRARNIVVEQRESEFGVTPFVEKLTYHSRSLYAMIFEPLLGVIGDRRRLFMCAEGELSTLAIGALVDDNGEYLLQKYEINYLTSGRDVVRFRHEIPGGKDVAVFADPDFDCIPGRGPSRVSREATDIRMSRAVDPGKFHFSRLEKTSEEGRAIAGIFKDKKLHTQQRLREKATESAFFGTRLPRVLHVASHGFFLQDQEAPESKEGSGLTRDIGVFAREGVFAPSPSDLKLENPLLRSGLALAGANRWCQGLVKEGEEDGIITAEEISGMELRGTDIVVLSACDTGLGDVKVGQGVMGLQRAFIHSGAKTLMTSLWKIPDEETKDLMISFYRRYAGGTPKGIALREAQLEMIRLLRAQGREHPLFWAGFILTGDPGKTSPITQVKDLSPVKNVEKQKTSPVQTKKADEPTKHIEPGPKESTASNNVAKTLKKKRWWRFWKRAL